VENGLHLTIPVVISDYQAWIFERFNFSLTRKNRGSTYQQPYSLLRYKREKQSEKLYADYGISLSNSIKINLADNSIVFYYTLIQ
jgi:hypothetical protein